MKYMKLLILTITLLFLIGCEQATDEQLAPTKIEVTQETPPVQTPVTPGAAISLEVEERDFGTIWDFESVTTTFPFTNTGTKTLVLTRLQAGCGCTTPIADKTVLQPGESGTITVTFDPKGKANKQDKKVTIFSNAVNAPEKGFWIRSYVNQFVDVKNKFLSLNEMALGESHSVEFEFTPIDPNFKILSMSGTGKHGQFVTAEELEMPEGSPRRVRININPNMPWGAFHSQLKVKGTGTTPEGNPINHEFTIFANGKTYGKIRADKHIISLGTLGKGGSFHVRNNIFRADGEPFNVLNTAILQPTVSGINGSAIQNIDGSYTLMVTGTLPPSHQGPINAELMVQTDVPGEEVLRFRVTGVVPKR
jgi:hypothetical protein